MKLENCNLIIESRREIDVLQDMIELYLERKNISRDEERELTEVKNQLDTLYISW